MTLLTRAEREAWLASHPAAASLDVVSIYRPQTIAALTEALDEIEADACVAFPVGQGHHLPAPAGIPLALLLTEALDQELLVDPLAMTARVSASTTWQALELEASKHGLTAHHVVDAFDDGTIGGTLGRRSWIPGTWESASARSETTGVSGVTHRGQRYRGVDAPKTASGPDLRSVFLGADGRAGTLTRATLTLVAASTSRWFTRSLHGAEAVLRDVRELIVRDPRHIALRWPTADTLAVSVIGSTAITDAHVATLTALGFDERPWPSRPTPAPTVVVTMPWADALNALDADRQLVVGGTSTHLAIARAAGPETDAWARACVALPLTRVTGLGTAVPAPLGPLARPLQTRALGEDHP